MAKRKNGQLPPKEKLFVAEYLKDFNATQAAIRAGYSKNTAYHIGYENLKFKLHLLMLVIRSII